MECSKSSGIDLNFAAINAVLRDSDEATIVVAYESSIAVVVVTTTTG